MDISSRLQQLLQHTPPETQVRDFLMNYLENQHNIVLQRNMIEFHTTTIRFICSPIIKSQLKNHYSEIQEIVNNFLQEKNISRVVKKII